MSPASRPRRAAGSASWSTASRSARCRGRPTRSTRKAPPRARTRGRPPGCRSRPSLRRTPTSEPPGPSGGRDAPRRRPHPCRRLTPAHQHAEHAADRTIPVCALDRTASRRSPPRTMLRLLHRVVAVEPGERRGLLLATAWFFCLLASYYLLRPVRDALGVERGETALKWLFLATFLATLVVVPAYAWLAGRLPRQR